MPSVYSKLMHHTCYEIGHTWNSSCCYCMLEGFLSAFIYSCKMYGLVYGITSALQIKRIKDWKDVVKLLKNYLRSAIFVAINGFGYIGFFCLLRQLLGHINFSTISFMPGFLSALMAISVERASRRPLLAIHVANIATECAFNVWSGHGYVHPMRHGSVLLFSLSMGLLGWMYHSAHHQPPPFLASLIKYFVGAGECGSQTSSLTQSEPTSQQGRETWFARVLCNPRHRSCPHSSSCLHYALKAMASGGVKGFLGSLALKLLSIGTRSPASLPRLLLSPTFLLKLLLNPDHLRLALFVAWFSGAFRFGACACRRLSNGESPTNGAVAGSLAALGMWFNPSPSLALYSAWKTLEVLCCMGVKSGHLPALPYATELLYSIMTGYLFHVAAVHQQYIKPSYWRLLLNLTDGRMAQFNRHLLYPYKMDSARNFNGFWPDYKLEDLSPAFLHAYPDGLVSIPQ